ncbi:hypothetical protein GLP43_16010 [Sulfitobacter sp. M39]|uniref:sulfotransferase family protein n=1 Tax=Sulfitobacter sp. M39 TaxID=2675334 RepID=UPI001F18F218|nr:sulfotransferase [Sulfitobacter sp. M39]MCF7749059.1 hypothetical protein [Sulfitobacter sp. M39]
MKIWKRLLAFSERNRGALFRNAIRQTAVRIWIRYKLWRFFGPILPARDPKTWVFMAGCYNSGTTILREMIGAHPDVASLPREGVEMTEAFPDLEAGGWVRMWYRNAKAADLTNRDPHSLARRAKRDWSLWWRRGAPVFIEKSIIHGAWMPTLDAGFPNARFIGVIRNGYCVCEGIRRRARPNDAARSAIDSDVYPIEEVGRQWNFANKTLLRDRAVVQNYHEVRYENFAAEPLKTIQSIFTFIGVDPDVVMIRNDGQLEIGGRTFRIQNQNAESLSRLEASEKDRLWSEIGPMMTELSYLKETSS